MSIARTDQIVRFRSVRRRRPETAIEIHYQPRGPAVEAVPGTLDHFLTERYCLYTLRADGRLRRLEIHHPPWQLQRVDADFARNTLASSQGIRLPDAPPLLHFSQRQDVIAWWPETV